MLITLLIPPLLSRAALEVKYLWHVLLWLISCPQFTGIRGVAREEMAVFVEMQICAKFCPLKMSGTDIFGTLTH